MIKLRTAGTEPRTTGRGARKAMSVTVLKVGKGSG